jgi:hypothetical protein
MLERRHTQKSDPHTNSKQYFIFIGYMFLLISGLTNRHKKAPADDASRGLVCP